MRKLGKVRITKKRLIWKKKQKTLDSKQCLHTNTCWLFGKKITDWKQVANARLNSHLIFEQKNKVINLLQYSSPRIHSCLAPISICKMNNFHFRRPACRRSEQSGYTWLHIIVGYKQKELPVPVHAQNKIRTHQSKCSRTSSTEAKLALNFTPEIQLLLENLISTSRSCSSNVGRNYKVNNPVSQWWRARILASCIQRLLYLHIQWHVQLVHLLISKCRTSILFLPYSPLQDLREKKKISDLWCLVEV